MAGRSLLIPRSAYEARAGANLGKVRWHKPIVRPVMLGDTSALVKDYRFCPLIWRITYGRAMIMREIVIYTALDGLPGIPRLLGRIDAYAIALQMVEGREVNSYPAGELPEGFLDRFEEAVHAMHARGVVHCDLRQRRNILVGKNGEPWLIDFASGVRLSRDFPLFDLLRQMDLSAVAKLRAKHDPGSLTAAHRRLMGLDRLRPLKLRRLRQRELKRQKRAGAG